MERPASRSGLMKFSDSRPVTAAGGRPTTRESEQYFDRTRDGSASVYQRQSVSRPTTSGRPLSNRPTSSALRGAPATASRLISTASSQRPASRGNLASGIGLTTPISVMERPITQQGLSGMKTGSRGPERQVQDKSYYMGILRTKANDLQSEIIKLNGELESMKQEHSTFLTYDKRVKEVAGELTVLQSTLANQNLLVDFINTDTELELILEEQRELKHINEEKEEKLDKLFTEKKDIELKTRQKESELAEERQMGESLIGAMDSSLRDRYLELRSMNSSYLQHLDGMQQQIDSLDAEKNSLESELSLSKVKQEAIGLYTRLQELKDKKEIILEENRQRGTPKEEQERLLIQVKEDNSEISTMERQIAEAHDEMNRLADDLQEIESQLEESQSERSTKYRELRKREATMEQFLETFEENRQEELQKLDDLEVQILNHLEKISKNQTLIGHLPSSKEYGNMTGDLDFKQGELEKSKFTEQNLQSEMVNLQANIQKIDVLEAKVSKEKEDLMEKLQKMNDELVEYSDLPGLRQKMEDKRKMLAQQKEELEVQLGAVRQSMKDVATSTAVIKKQLSENQTYEQLENLEKKWAQLEQINFNLREIIAQKRDETNFMPLKNHAMTLTMSYNKALQEMMHNGGSIA